MNKPELIYKTYIRSTPEKTWEAITNPEFTRQYWGGMANVSEWKQGSDWQHVNPDNESWVIGKIEECDPPKRLVLTWIDPDNPADISRVSFEIELVRDTVCLTVIHNDFQADTDMAASVSKGWPLVLSSLKSFLETGTGLDVACGG